MIIGEGLLARVYGKIAIIEKPLVLCRRDQTSTTIIHSYSTSERRRLDRSSDRLPLCQPAMFLRSISPFYDYGYSWLMLFKQDG
jgi:hypothetical protein